MAIRDSLVSWWDMDETSGTRVDAHGSNDLGDVNTVGYTASGISGNAADFVGANVEYLNIDDGSQSGLEATNFSFMVVGKLKSLTPGGYLGGKAYSTTHDVPYSSYLLGIEGSGDGGNPYMSVAQDASTIKTVTGTTTISSTSTWYMLVGTFDGSNIRIHLNGGTAEATVACTGVAYSTGQFRLATIPSYPNSGYTLNGYIARAAYWSRKITDAEISEIWNSGTVYKYADTAPAASGPANLKSLDTNLKANIKSYNTNLIANIKSINTNT